MNLAVAPAAVPITAAERLQWVVQSTALPTNIMAEALRQHHGDRPAGQRNRSRAGRGVGRRPALSAGGARHVVFGAPDSRGEVDGAGTQPRWPDEAAYARFIAIPAAAGISNIWRPDSETEFDNFAARTAFGFAGHFGGNAWNEFWPDVKKKLLHKGAADTGPFKGL